MNELEIARKKRELVELQRTLKDVGGKIDDCVELLKNMNAQYRTLKEMYTVELVKFAEFQKLTKDQLTYANMETLLNELYFGNDGKTD